MILAQQIAVLDPLDLLLRVAAAGALGGLVGLEREMRDQPAGFRTHILVSLGAALFTLVGAYGVESFFAGAPPNVNHDPTRVAAQVVTGIGFLGAGAIIRQGVSIRGLTTAAALWVTAAIGVAAAFGFWLGAIGTTVVTIFALYGFKVVESRLLTRLKEGRFEYTVDARPSLKLSDLARSIETRSVRMRSLSMLADEEENIRLVFGLHLPRWMAPQDVVDILKEIEGVTNVEWTR